MRPGWLQGMRELLSFVYEERKYALAPLVVVLVLLALFILWAEIPALTPFIYALF